MSLSQAYFNQQTLSGTNTQLGGNISTPGHYTLYVDCTAMASGDTVILQFKVQVASGGSFVLRDSVTLTNAQSPAVAKIEAVMVPFQGQVFAQQTGGTLRSVTWTIFRVDD